MKTYILRDPKTVEPQTSPRPLRPDPALTATVDMICGRPVPPPSLLAELMYGSGMRLMVA